MLTEKDYCDYDTCVALLELGLPQWELPYEILSKKYRLCLYDAQKWLRERKRMIIVISPYSYDCINEVHTWTYEVWLGDNLQSEAYKFNSYEEALLEGIKEAVKLLKEEK